MAQRKLVLWTLNRCTTWNLDRMKDALDGTRNLFFPQHQVSLGNRNAFNATVGNTIIPFEASWASELHHEGQWSKTHGASAKVDEYFVPIPVKTIGDPARFEAFCSVSGKKILTRIKEKYAEYYGPNGTWREYWTGGVDISQTAVKMNTKTTGVGLYEVLRGCTNPGEKHVLIGYSQGGLVARYLQYLDEHLAKDPIIAGVITVQSPLAGSPVARPANKSQVMAGILESLFSLSHMSPDVFPTMAGFIQTELTDRFNMQTLIGLLDSATRDIKTKLNDFQRGERKALIEILMTARKWVSGLDVHPERFAFSDINTDRVRDKDRVLHALAMNAPTSGYYGSVVGTDNRIRDIAGLQGALTTPLFALIETWLHLVDAGKSYRETVMRESAFAQQGATDDPAGTALMNQKRAEYENGIFMSSPRYAALKLNLPIGPTAHDFVIPSVNQLSEPGTSASAFLGNLVNPDAGHLSGALRTDSSPNDEELTCDLLARMADALDKKANP